ncbi:type II secretion system F family protein [Quadrisphaera sp. DSM 44207]|uniref:type II secretion system F family protein n=1 Tax=Quadrisphaera sp. DSM 44207 TaxID=1881057 RepID=UPI000889D307|nr:type II secretion system F family protein [Quadrisphaera sp. DSM 44207]SDQ17743.1 Type II secretion system (T2SS), protein F [Quadrisphaera sp. DSM 44207]
MSGALAAAVAALCLLAAVLVGSHPGAEHRLRRVAGPHPSAGAAPGSGGPGRRRARALLRDRRAGRRAAARYEPVDAALVLDLLAAAVQAGAPPVPALAVVGRAVGGSGGAALVRVADLLRLGAAEELAWAGAPGGCAAVRRCLHLAESTGAPVAALLTAAAGEVRRRRARAGQLAAARLGVRVVLPLGLCALPGFAALGVVPVVLGLAGAVLRP